MKKISAFLFNKILGWRVANEVPRLPKCVITVAPHTSNWDFIVAKLAYSSLGRTAHFLIKSEWFVFPFNLFFKRIGVSRSSETEVNPHRYPRRGVSKTGSNGTGYCTRRDP